MNNPFNKLSVVALLTVFVWTVPAWAQSGHVLNGVGPIDQAMAGAGMAAPQDALVPLHWNPAAITSLPKSYVDVSLQVMEPSGNLVSSVEQGAFGPFGPPVTFSGETSSTAGPFPIPALGYARIMPDSKWAFGISAFGVGGFGVEYAGSAFTDDQPNPILTPQPATGQGLGFGSISSEFGLFQVAPTVAYRISERVSVGVAPTLNYATLTVSPFPAASPDAATGLYPDAPKEGAFGFGFQAGLHAQTETGLSLGLSFKSEQYFSDFEFQSEEFQNYAPFKFNLDYPMIVSAGLAYDVDRVLLAADIRYIDFAHTHGFEFTGYDETGAVVGFGWESIIVAALGVQYEVADGVPIRLGYSYNENPIPDTHSFFNTPAPAIIQHHLAGGFGVRINQRLRANAAVQYGLKNECEGKWVMPDSFGGENPGTSVKSELSTLTVIAGVSFSL